MASTDHGSDGSLRDDFQPDTGHDFGDDATDVRPNVSRFNGGALRANAPWPNREPQQAPRSDPDPEPLPRWRRDAPGGRSTDGSALRTARGRGDLERPNFNVSVGPNGYAWWYVDGLSDDHSKAVSVIGFIGSVFSPWYRWSGRKRPQNHVCINVATYGPGGRFTMTDRGESALRQTASRLEVGPSMMRWEGDRLIIDINEMSSHPWINRIQGQITVIPSAVTQVELPLTQDDSHIWRPFAPRARINVDIDRPGWQWTGEGYFDANFGTRALEEDFSYWTWGRFPTKDGATCIYDATRLDGSELAAGFAFDPDGTARQIALPPKARMKRSLWALYRETRADLGYQPYQVRPMLDAPFYNRAAVRTQLDGEEVTGVHESLDLTRFRSPLLKPMLAVRVPRRPRWRF